MSDKTKTINRISNAFKLDMVRVALRALLIREPNLTRAQVQQIFNYGYRLFWTKKEGELYEQARKEIRRGKGPLGPFAVRTIKRSSKSNNKGPKKVRTKRVAKSRKRN